MLPRDPDARLPYIRLHPQNPIRWAFSTVAGVTTSYGEGDARTTRDPATEVPYPGAPEMRSGLTVGDLRSMRTSSHVPAEIRQRSSELDQHTGCIVARASALPEHRSTR
jgi:hypothetical protein